MTKTRSVRVRMLRLLRWRALTAAGALFLLVAASCVSIGPEHVQVSDIESTFPALTRLRVTAYRDQDWCKVLAYARGSFSETEVPQHVRPLRRPSVQLRFGGKG
jgi:hypothetical protein